MDNIDGKTEPPAAEPAPGPLCTSNIQHGLTE